MKNEWRKQFEGAGRTGWGGVFVWCMLAETACDVVFAKVSSAEYTIIYDAMSVGIHGVDLLKN